jgi:hypothetical protein
MEAYEAGTRFIETLWYSYACRIVETFISLYKVSDERAAELREKFLKRGDYRVQDTEAQYKIELPLADV